MPAPTNTDATTAIDLGSFPASVTQDVNFGGTTYAVFYKFTAAQTGVVSAFGYGVIGGSNTTYQAILAVSTGDPTDPTQWPVEASPDPVNRPGQFPVTEGETYFLRYGSFFNNVADPAILTLNTQYFTQGTAVPGSLVIPSDTDGLVLWMFSHATGDLQQFGLGYPGGEEGTSEPSIGAVLLDDNHNSEFKLYTSSLSFVGSLARPSATGINDVYISFGRVNHSFYAGWISSGTTMALRRLSPSDLTVQQSWTLSSVTAITALAPNAAETILYLCGKAGFANSAISKYDLVSPGFLTDFAATISGYVVCDLLVMSDDTVVVLYQKNTATKDLLVKTYDNTGSVLHSKSYGSAITTSTDCRMGYALDDPNSFWLWIHVDDGTATVKNVKVSDLSDIVSWTKVAFEFGNYQGVQSSDPQRFGFDESCPIFVLRGSVATTETFTIRRQRRFLLPSSPDNKTVQMPVLELLMRTGIGLTPTDAWGGSVPLGVDPKIMIRISKDGGATWGPERVVSASRLGNYAQRVRLTRFSGNYRNAVVEVTVADPVAWDFLAAMAPNGLIQGTS